MKSKHVTFIRRTTKPRKGLEACGSTTSVIDSPIDMEAQDVLLRMSHVLSNSVMIFEYAPWKEWNPRTGEHSSPYLL